MKSISLVVAALVLASSAFAEFSSDQYNQVQIGMKYSDVCNILGGEGLQIKIIKVVGRTTVGYRWMSGNTVIYGIFQSKFLGPLSVYGINGSVVLKSKQIMFLNESAARAASAEPTAQEVQEPAPAPLPIPPPVLNPWEASADADVADNNGSVCHLAYHVQVRNNTDKEMVFAGVVNFLDREGVTVDSSPVNNVRVGAHSEKGLNGTKMMMSDAASTIVKAKADLTAN